MRKQRKNANSLTGTLLKLPDNRLLSVVAFMAIVSLIALLAWLTADEETDPCAAQNQDLGAAVLADGEHDQGALVNRAIIVRGQCERK